MAPYDQKTPKWKSLILPSQPTLNMLKTLNSDLMSREDLTGFQRKKSLNASLVADIFREEMYSKTFENLNDVVREVREELSTYRDNLEISDHVKKSEPKKDFGKDKRNFSQENCSQLNSGNNF